MKANWKLLIENSIDGYHAMATHHRYLQSVSRRYRHADTSAGLGPNRHQGIGLALGGGHAVIENRARPTPITAQQKPSLTRSAPGSSNRFGPERAHRIADFNRNLFIFPNLILISNRGTRSAPSTRWRRTTWRLTPGPTCRAASRPELRQRRFENFISFLGPAGFGTPDDVSGLEGCQRGFAAWRELPWSDISRGMGREQPSSQDELQMRAFWRRWNALMQGRGSDRLLRPAGATRTRPSKDRLHGSERSTLHARRDRGVPDR